MDKIDFLIQNLPKAELHVHIEGTFEPEQMFEFARRNKIKIAYKNVDSLKKAYKFNDLQEFLDIYYVGSNVLKTEMDFYELTMAYLKKASEQNVVHAEIFFDPQTHLENGVSFAKCFDGIYHATVDAEEEYSIHADLIMCFLRHLSEESALDTLQKSLPFREQILGVGLDSSEKGNPPVKFLNVFRKCKEMDFKLVAHAGEEGPVSYVNEALNMLLIDRIDHGNKITDDHKLIEQVVSQRIPLTMCPLSNQKLGVVKDLKNHPIKGLLDKNVLVTVNSDDPAYFGGYINENFIALQQALNLDKSDVLKLVSNSFSASFLPQPTKDFYLSQLKNYSV